MPEQEDWKEEFGNKFGDWLSPSGDNEIKTFISSLLSSQSHALKEQMIAEIKKQKQWIFTTQPGLEEVSGKIIPRVIEDSEFILVKKLLSAIESIEI